MRRVTDAFNAVVQVEFGVAFRAEGVNNCQPPFRLHHSDHFSEHHSGLGHMMEGALASDEVVGGVSVRKTLRLAPIKGGIQDVALELKAAGAPQQLLGQVNPARKTYPWGQ